MNIGIEEVVFPLSADIEEDLKKVESTWLQLEEFKEGLKEYEEEDWIVFRTRPQRLEEFLIRWETQFKSQTKTDIIVRILKDIESYKVCTDLYLYFIFPMSIKVMSYERQFFKKLKVIFK